ncbi:peptidylprolyl isomerase [Kutzneria sp. 744]|uniref:peptidylprolyl isomerase n=1 Tax=Kutzneria sp. (strain 744) TaxID=345341 RepID=UPI00350ED866
MGRAQVPSNEQRREAAKRKLERQLVRRAQRARRRRVTSISVTTVVVLLVAGGIWFAVANAGSGSSTAASPSSDAPTSTSKPPITIPTALAAAPKRPTPLAPTVDCKYTKEGDAAKANNLPNGSGISTQGTVTVTLKTNDGDIPLTLDRALAPCAVNSFVSLSGQGYYDNTSCHRLSTSGLQMLQCGDPKGDGTGGPGYKFDDEVWPSLTYGRGYLAMANSGPNTNGSQFFLVYGDAQLQPNLLSSAPSPTSA